MSASSTTNNTISDETNQTQSPKALTLSALLAQSLSAKKDQVGYPQPHTTHFSQRPSRPPHGTRRAMGKR